MVKVRESMGKLLMAFLAFALVFGAACGGDDDDDNATDVTVVGNGTPPAGGTPADGAVTSVDTTVAIDADASTPAIDAQATYASGAEFQVAFAMQDAGGGYEGYQFSVGWDPAVISYVTDSVEHLRPEDLSTCSPTRTYNGTEGATQDESLPPNRVAAFCASTQLNPTEYEGPLSTVRFTCSGTGQSALSIQTSEEVSPGTKVETRTLGIAHRLQVANATVSCQ
jgi:hypothetical protein